jgi:hypothetical protein
MANLRIFISSTCYDLQVVRGQLRTFLEGLGYEPVMSEYSDVVYDPRIHTHTSCLDEVTGCDMAIVIIGSRFGGKVVPQATLNMDFEALSQTSKSVELLQKCEHISITQLEILKAIEMSVPVFAFVDERVWQDHATYEKNKAKPIIDSIEFSSIEKPETARYIFEFINFLRHRFVNNSVIAYSKYQDIEETLRKQWAGLFQRLLLEQRNKQVDARRIDALTEQFEDLKAAILTSVGTKNEREVARGVVRFRRLCDFLRGFGLPSYKFVLNETHSWQEFLVYLDIIGITEVETEGDARAIGPGPVYLLLKSDRTFYEMRYFRVSDLNIEWEAFMNLDPEARSIIFDTLSEMRSAPANRYIRHIQHSLEEYQDRTNVSVKILSGESEAIRILPELQD